MSGKNYNSWKWGTHSGLQKIITSLLTIEAGMRLRRTNSKSCQELFFVSLRKAKGESLTQVGLKNPKTHYLKEALCSCGSKEEKIPLEVKPKRLQKYPYTSILSIYYCSRNIWFI